LYRPDALPDAKALKATSTGGNSTESILASIIKCIFTGFQKIPKKKIQGAFLEQHTNTQRCRTT